MTHAQRKLRLQITKGVEAAVERALDRHRRLGEQIAVWKSGKVVTLKPKQIPRSPQRKRK